MPCRATPGPSAVRLVAHRRRSAVLITSHIVRMNRRARVGRRARWFSRCAPICLMIGPYARSRRWAIPSPGSSSGWGTSVSRQERVVMMCCDRIPASSRVTRSYVAHLCPAQPPHAGPFTRAWSSTRPGTTAPTFGPISFTCGRHTPRRRAGAQYPPLWCSCAPCRAAQPWPSAATAGEFRAKITRAEPRGRLIKFESRALYFCGGGRRPAAAVLTRRGPQGRPRPH